MSIFQTGSEFTSVSIEAITALVDIDRAAVILLHEDLSVLHSNPAARRLLPDQGAALLKLGETTDLIGRARRMSGVLPGRVTVPERGSMRADAAWLSRDAEALAVLRLFPDRGGSVFADLNRRLAERAAALREHSRQLSKAEIIFDATHDGILVVEASGQVRRFNRAFARMMPRARPGDRMEDLIDLGALSGAAGIDALDGAKGEVYLRRGEPLRDLPVEVAFGVGRGAGSDPVLVATLRDLTERNDRDEALARATLMDTARQRAEEGERAKSRFLSMMSHEMRTPLNGLIASAELLSEDDTLSNRQRRLAGIILGSAETALAQVNDLLDVARSEERVRQTRDLPLDPGRIAAEMVAQFQPLAATRGNVLTLEAPRDLPALRGDPALFQRILQNLVGNALKFTRFGQITLRLSVEPSGDRPDDTVILRTEVQDTGIGIAADRIERMFLPFEKGESDDKTQSAGSGLGLAIVRATVTEMGGTLDVDSTPGTGSRFAFSVPLSRDSTAAAPLPVLPSDVAVPKPQHTPGPLASVLIADDSDVNRIVLRELLLAAGASVTEATNGLEAWQEARRGAFDLVLMDVSMPLLDGIAATRLIRNDPATRSLPVLALTAHSETDVGDRCRAAGMARVLAKPIRSAQIRTLIDEFGRRSSRPPSATSPGAPTDLFDAGLRSEMIDLMGMAEFARMARQVLGNAMELGRRASEIGLEEALCRLTELHGSAATLGITALGPVLKSLRGALQDGSREEVAQLGGVLHGLSDATRCLLGEAEIPSA